MEIKEKVFEDQHWDSVIGKQDYGGNVWIAQRPDTVVMSRATFLAICRHLGVTQRELEGTDA